MTASITIMNTATTNYLCSGEPSLLYVSPPVASYDDIFPVNENYEEQVEDMITSQELAGYYKQFGIRGTMSFAEYDAKRLAEDS